MGQGLETGMEKWAEQARVILEVLRTSKQGVRRDSAELWEAFYLAFKHPWTAVEDQDGGCRAGTSGPARLFHQQHRFPQP